ncbi:hypothetical protein PUN28_002572 [Cardiocondyla obscurior]|uniref:Uncharacterized protein n=1 Tax=Cardiocondyla obscurior TaxID=286306 RepID=A0AAW2GV50_9HYME
MLYRKAAVFLIIQIHVLQAISHAIDTQDTKIFEIAVDDANYNEESENEMIQPKDVADFKSLIEDKDRYRPLHSHVKYYNERNSENTKPYSNMFLYLQSHMKEIFNLEQENKPFIAGFKNNLDKYFSKTIRQSTDVRPVKITKHINFEKNKKVINHIIMNRIVFHYQTNRQK